MASVTAQHHVVYLAHGVGNREDLPIPAHDAFIGAALALIVSFVVLGLAWRTSRFHGDDSGRPLPRWLADIIDSPVTHAVLVTFALLFASWLTLAAFFGKDTLVNPVFGSVYVLLWVGLVPAALVFGPIYRLCNPLRWLHRGICALARIDYRNGLYEYPRRVGLWPAALTLFAFAWLELVDANLSTSLSTILLWFGFLAVFLVAGAMVFGDVWFARADPFEVYSSLVARLSPFGRRTDGVLVIRNPLENLDGMSPLPGLVGTVSVLLGSTAFDAFHGSAKWLSWSQKYTDHLVLVNNLGLIGFCLAVLLSLSLASIATAGLGSLPRRDLPAQFAHSIVPIVVGYVVAHYLSFFVSQGLQTLVELGDPFTRGWTAMTWVSDQFNVYAIYEHPTGLAVTKVVAVVIGHVLGVISAHDRAVRLLPRRHAIVGQLPMLVLMVAYTLTGLWLLFLP
ncbi:MAG TPA: hypothetical protein VLK34_07190 [Nocardioidaceae bacterium]|nr:hypothetical protein [Nocardioidaceae bacterium]